MQAITREQPDPGGGCLLLCECTVLQSIAEEYRPVHPLKSITTRSAGMHGISYLCCNLYLDLLTFWPAPQHEVTMRMFIMSGTAQTKLHQLVVDGERQTGSRRGGPPSPPPPLGGRMTYKYFHKDVLTSALWLSNKAQRRLHLPGGGWRASGGKPGRGTASPPPSA